jgi:hypothetical protein
MSTNVVRLRDEMEVRLFRFKNEPKIQPLTQPERLEESRVRSEKIFNDIMARALAKAITR